MLPFQSMVAHVYCGWVTEMGPGYYGFHVSSRSFPLCSKGVRPWLGRLESLSPGSLEPTRIFTQVV